MLEPQWNFKGGGLPWPESSLPQGKRCKGHTHTHGKKIKGRTSYALHKVSTARGGGKGGTIFTTHLLPQNQGMNCICKRHCLSKSLDIQHVGVGGWLGLSRTAAKMGRGRGWTHTQPVKSCA